jgi:hypothetical protein
MSTSTRDRDEALRRVWKQRLIPVVFRRAGLPLLVKVPPSVDNRRWLRGTRHTIPVWDDQYKAWQVPRIWFEPIVKLCVDHYGKCYVVQLHREMQICAPACWNAQGFCCECSCMGEHHGSSHPLGRWYEIDETLAVSWGVQRYACRLIRAKAYGPRTD